MATGVTGDAAMTDATPTDVVTPTDAAMMGDAMTPPANPWEAWNQAYDYAVDFAQRSVLFWDTLRQRGADVLRAPDTSAAELDIAADELDIDPANTWAAICGPPVMYKYVIAEMRKKQMDVDKIYVSFERRMKCGVGKCGHCQINGVYVCKSGPVFSYSEVKGLREAIH